MDGVQLIIGFIMKLVVLIIYVLGVIMLQIKCIGTLMVKKIQDQIQEVIVFPLVKGKVRAFK